MIEFIKDFLLYFALPFCIGFGFGKLDKKKKGDD